MDDYERGLEAWVQFDLTGDDEILGHALILLRSAVSGSPADQKDKRSIDLGRVLGRLYDQTHDLDTLTESLEILALHVDIRRPDMGTYSLAIGYQNLGVENEDVDETDKCIALLRMISTHADTDTALRARALSALSTALQDRYEYAQDIAALAEAVVEGRKALQITPPDSPRRGPHLSHLGLALRMTYESSGERRDLDDAIAAHREAVAAISEDEPSKDIEIGMLSLVLRFLFDATGDLEALDESIACQRQVLKILPARHGRVPSNLSNLSLALQARFDAVGDVATLDESISAAREAVATTSPDSSDRRMYANNLGQALSAAGRVRPDSGELDEAISILKATVADTTGDRNLLHEAASNLALALRQRGRDEGDYRDALIAALKADEHAPQDHLARVRYKTLIGVLHRGAADRGKEPDKDLALALAALRGAHLMADSNNPDRATAALELAKTLLSVHPASIAGRHEALQMAMEAASTSFAGPRITVDAARLAAELLADSGQHSRAIDYYEKAVDELARLAPGTTDIVERGSELEHFLGLASEGASEALESGETERAIGLLERGRSLLFGAVLDDGPRFSALRVAHPDLANRFEGLRRRVDIGGVDRYAFLENDDRRRHRRDWDEVVAEIRGKAGFESFLRPGVELSRLDNDDPIIVLIVGRSRCHAVVVKNGVPEHVRLEGVEPASVRSKGLALRKAIDAIGDTPHGMTNRAEKRFATLFSEVSEWMFNRLILPIRSRIGAAERANWILTGSFAGLPIHVAGENAPGDLLDVTVSNHAATIGSLLNRHGGSADRDVIALIGSADARLNGAAEEIRLLSETLTADTVLPGEEATVEAVLAAFRSSDVVHVATHGFDTPRRRFASGLSLADGAVSPIALARSGLALNLVYLSACDTAAADFDVSDEPLHFAAALRASGCRNVVAATWPLDDIAGSALAAAFYSEGVPLDSASSLNRAQRTLRDSNPDRPSAWAALTHWGPLR